MLRIQITFQQQDRRQFVNGGLALFYRRIGFAKDALGRNAREALVPVDNRDAGRRVQPLGKFGGVGALQAIFSTHVQGLPHEKYRYVAFLSDGCQFPNVLADPGAMQGWKPLSGDSEPVADR